MLVAEPATDPAYWLCRLSSSFWIRCTTDVLDSAGLGRVDGRCFTNGIVYISW